MPSYITVVTRQPEAVPSYLYRHTRLLASSRVRSGLTLVLLETNGATHAVAAEGQAERLSSGLHSSRAFESLDDAMTHALEAFGVFPVLTHCEWYARCDRPASGSVDHPLLGEVPTCWRCADRHDMELKAL